MRFSASRTVLVIDELGCSPLPAEVLCCSRSSTSPLKKPIVITTNQSVGARGGIFGDPIVASAMIDRIVNHADVLSLKCASYNIRSHQSAASTQTKTTLVPFSNGNLGPVSDRH